MKKIITVLLSVVLIAGTGYFCYGKATAAKSGEARAAEPKGNPPIFEKADTNERLEVTQDESKISALIQSANKMAEASGIYIGQIDGNSIEVKLDNNGSTKAFRLDEIKYTFKGFKKNDKVKIIYYTNSNNQLILKSIEKVLSGSTLKEAAGTYMGMIDNNSIEIKLDKGGYAAFRIEEVKSSFKGFKKNSRVKVTYEVNKYGQNMIKNIVQIK